MVDRASALAVMPLPSLATYFTASDLIALLQTGPPYEGLGFMGGPFAIGLIHPPGHRPGVSPAGQAAGLRPDLRWSAHHCGTGSYGMVPSGLQSTHH
jgi:hypothetical protein